MTRGREHGCYLAVCGHLVLAAALTAPPARRCLSCCAVGLAESRVAPPVPAGDRRRARRGCNARYRWLVSRCHQSLAG
jgi:hypothetical protein